MRRIRLLKYSYGDLANYHATTDMQMAVGRWIVGWVVLADDQL